MLISSGPLTLQQQGTSVRILLKLKSDENILSSVWNMDLRKTKVLPPEEGHAALRGHSFSQQRFSRPRWSVQQDSSPVQTQRQELRMLQRKLDRVQDVFLHLLQTSNILPAHIRDLFTWR